MVGLGEGLGDGVVVGLGVGVEVALGVGVCSGVEVLVGLGKGLGDGLIVGVGLGVFVSVGMRGVWVLLGLGAGDVTGLIKVTIASASVGLAGEAREIGRSSDDSFSPQAEASRARARTRIASDIWFFTAGHIPQVSI